MKTLRSINLNLLPVLRELLRKRSVTRAAEALGKSQPATSEALRQLRRQFNDELLVLEGQRYVPTALASRLERQLESALGMIEDFALSDQFDPATAIGTVRIASNDYVILTWGRLLAAHLAAVAPNVSLEFEDAMADSGEKLGAGLVDFLTLPSDALDMVKARHDTVGLFDDDLVCLVPADSPVGATISRDELTCFPHATYTPGGRTEQGVIAEVLEREAIAWRSRISVPVFSLLPQLVVTTGAVALTHRRLAEPSMLPPGVRVAELPFPCPKVHVVAISRKDAHRDPLLEWLRDEFGRVATAGFHA